MNSLLKFLISAEILFLTPTLTEKFWSLKCRWCLRGNSLWLAGFWLQSTPNRPCQSKEVYLAAQRDDYDTEWDARALSGLIVSEAESNDPTSYIGLQDPFSEAGWSIILARRKAIQRRKRRLTSNVGADAWRRMGVLTYNCRFSYSTIVQLCVARNKYHFSSQRYKGVAKVTTRRTHKGFSLKYNPDSHWSATFYKGLNSFSCLDFCVINRDDAAGFRPDTLTTVLYTICERQWHPNNKDWLYQQIPFHTANNII